MSRHPHVTNVRINRNPYKHVVTVEPLGDERAEIEAAVKRAYLGETEAVRSALIAADVAEPNEQHMHYRAYKNRAERISVTRETVMVRGLEHVRVTIEEDDD